MASLRLLAPAYRPQQARSAVSVVATGAKQPAADGRAGQPAVSARRPTGGRGSVTLDGNEEPSSSLAHRKEPQVTFRVAADLRANRLKEPLRWEAVTRAYLCF